MRHALLAVALAGCNYVTDSYSINTFSGDPFPTGVETSSGAIVLGLNDGLSTHTAVLDLLSPFSVLDRGPDEQQAVEYPQLEVLGERMIGGTFDLPRALLDGPQTLILHPCSNLECTVGTPADPRPFDAILGVSAFSSDALRLRLSPDPTTIEDQIFILADIAGDDTHRTRSCDAVFPSPFRGGGTLLVGGTELQFSGWRVVFDTCLAPMPFAETQDQRGTDALLVASTAIGISLLDRSAYDRYQMATPGVVPFDQLLDLETVLLPSGPVTGVKTSIPAIALAAKSSSDPRAPCRQVYASHFMFEQDCASGSDPNCPCANGSTFCTTPAILELAPTTGVDVLIIDDDNETLQALRTELRPDQPEVDGILGTEVLRALEIDVDYPNGIHGGESRLLGRCTDLDPTKCLARPQLVDETDRTQANGCIGF